ncbi:MAG: nucleotidyltransferase family protein [Acidobacteriota bacterium]
MRRLAAALAGDAEALATLAADPAGADLAKLHRLGPALALRARRLGIEGPNVDAWRRSLLGATAHRLVVDEALAGLGATLGAAGVPWLPIKGCDLGPRVYDRPEERPVGDVDVLVLRADYLRARRALEETGWRSMVSGARIDAYLLEEGYAWQAMNAANLLLEVHHRLWGQVPPGLATAMMEKAEPDPALGPTARRLPLVHSWLLAAVHVWLSPPPRPLLGAWDLERIARLAPDLEDDAVRLATEWDLQLPAALAAAYADGLWPSEPNRRIADRLMDTLRPAERLVARRAVEREVESTALASIVLARLLSFRPSRAGWRSLIRRFWAHPGIVELETPPGRSWPARRLAHVLRSFRA